MTNFFSFRFQDRYFSSPNRTAPPPGLAPPVALPNDPTPSQLKKQIWSSNRYPYIPFILRTPFHGDLLSVLSIPVSRVQILGKEGSFHPPVEQAKQWRTLENIVAFCCKELTALYNERHQNPLSLTIPPLPSSFGYYVSHTTEIKVRQSLQQSFDGFEIYLAYFSFLICLCEFPVDGGRTLPWQGRLRQTKVHREWLDLLMKSPIVDFRRERQGTVMDVSSIGWAALAQIFPKASVPLWLYWGDNPLFMKMITPWVKAFRPNADAPIFNLPSAPSNTLPHQTSTAPLHEEPATPFPPVQPFCGQRSNETMAQFFARRWKANEEKKKGESELQTNTRKMRDEAMRRCPQPGKKGPKVYRWMLVDGYRIRHPVVRSEIDNQWDGFSPRELIYDAFNNCWDICSDYGDEFDQYFNHNCASDSEDSIAFIDNPRRAQNASTNHSPPQGPPQPPPDSEPPMLGLSSSALPTPPPIADEPNVEKRKPTAVDSETSSQRSTYDSAADVSHAASEKSAVNTSADITDPPCDSTSITTPDSQEIEIDIADEGLDTADIHKISSTYVVRLQAFHPIRFTTPQSETLDNLLYYRYGYLASSSPYAGTVSINANLDSWQNIARTTGGRFIGGSEVARRRIATFLTLIIDSDEPSETVGDVWDLDPSSTEYLDLRAPSPLTIERYPRLEGSPYVLRPTTQSGAPSPLMLATDATTALEAVRRRLGPSVDDIANFLITHGVTFHLYRRVPSLPKPKSLPSPTLPRLGSRPEGYIFDIADYVAYATRRDNFLRGEPRARVALLMGGVIARLARQVLEPNMAVGGPLSAAIEGQGKCIRVGQRLFVEDQLSDQEIDLILGLYVLEPDKTDESQQGHSKAQVSWFPRYDKWFDSGLNTGEWTHECELWFQDRVLDIQRGGQPLPQKEWRNKIRKNRLAPRLTYKLSTAASAFLDAQLPLSPT